MVTRNYMKRIISHNAKHANVNASITSNALAYVCKVVLVATHLLISLLFIFWHRSRDSKTC